MSVVVPDALELMGHDPDYIGSCPCAEFEYEGTWFEAHCWRPSCDAEPYAGLHYRGDAKVARRVFRAFRRMNWGEWTLVEGLRQ